MQPFSQFVKSQRFIIGATTSLFALFSLLIAVASTQRARQFNDTQHIFQTLASQNQLVYHTVIGATQLAEARLNTDAAVFQKMIQNDIAEFQTVQLALRTGSPDRKIPQITDKTSLDALVLVDQNWSVHVRNLTGLIEKVQSSGPDVGIDQYFDTLDEIHDSAGYVLDSLNRVTNTFQGLSDEIQAVVQRGLGLAVAIALVLLIVGGIPITWTRIALNKLLMVARRFTSGDYSARANTNTLSEFAEIAKTFNVLAETVERRTADLSTLNQSLEQRVLDRTAELQQANKDLQEATERALESTRLKSEFLANVSHELRTPLNAIIGFSDMLLLGMSGDLNEKQHHKMTRLKENGTRLLSLINNLLDLTKIEAGRLELIKKPFSPQTVIRQIAAQMESLIETRKLGFEVTIDPDLPATLVGDEKRIEQILVNLLSNAFKFTHTGKVMLHALANLDNLTWTIKVTDTGIGIPPHALNFIFEEFRQIDGSYSRVYQGSGLGLAITRSLVRSMDGKIGVESVLDQGSTFTVVLPLVLPESAPVSTLEAAQIQGGD